MRIWLFSSFLSKMDKNDVLNIMKKGRSKKIALAMIVISGLTSSYCIGDSFTHKTTKEVFCGYAEHAQNGVAVVHPEGKEAYEIKLSDYSIEPNFKGRNDYVALISIQEDVSYEIETEAFEKAIAEEANKGPLFILIEIDSPGGRVDLAKRVCAAILETKNCQTIAFIKGGKHGGAFSAAAAISFACDKIYISSDSVIGAATLILGGGMDVNKVLGDTVGEKMSSAWRNYLASLAQSRNRPGLLAKAMEDKDIEVIEVLDKNKRLFIEPINKKPEHKVVKTWCTKGTLLTLPAEDALNCNIVDKTVLTREQVLSDMKVPGATVTNNGQMEEARETLKKVNAKFERLRDSIDKRLTQATSSSGGMTRRQALKILRSVVNDTKQLLLLKKRYPDVPVSSEILHELLNFAEANYENIKDM